MPTMIAGQAHSIRIDKWLWSVRIFKTRSIAIEACKKGRVKVGNIEAKPSKEIKIGDSVTVRKPPINFTFRVIGIPKSRISAKLVAEFMENCTPPEELQKMEMKIFAFQGYRDQGAGRPTKKERRTLDEIKQLPFDDWELMWNEEEEN